MKRILFAFSLIAATTASFAQVAKPMEDVNKVIDNTADSLNQPQWQQPCALPDR